MNRLYPPRNSWAVKAFGSDLFWSPIDETENGNKNANDIKMIVISSQKKITNCKNYLKVNACKFGESVMVQIVGQFTFTFR